LLKESFPTIDAAAYQKHLFQMTVSPTHSVNLNGLHAAMTGLGLLGGGGAPPTCFLYFAVPPDVFPIYQHKAGSMVPSGSALPPNISLVVLEIPLPQSLPAAASASASSSSSAAASSSAGSKRKQQGDSADSLVPPSKQATVTKCECNTGCTKNTCKCFKHGNKCSARCHTAAAPASAMGCANH
jgi:hypothetical protein